MSHVRAKCTGYVGADGAALVDDGCPADLMHKAEIAGTQHRGCWLETVHQGSQRRCDVGREAYLGLWAHTVDRVGMKKELEKDM